MQVREEPGKRKLPDDNQLLIIRKTTREGKTKGKYISSVAMAKLTPDPQPAPESLLLRGECDVVDE
jgi:hypothetical protein